MNTPNNQDPVAEWLGRGRAALDAGRPDAALAEFQQGLARFPGAPALLRETAFALAALGQPGHSLAAVRQALAQQPGDAAAQNLLGTLLAGHGDAAGATAAFRTACELDPAFAAAWSNLGRSLQESGEHDAARDALTQALALQPELESARQLLAEGAMMAGDTAAAAGHFRVLLEHNPDAGLAWWGLANLKVEPFTAADVAAMQALAGRSPAADENGIAVRFALARALEDTGQFAEAAAATFAANAAARPHFPWNPDRFRAWLDACGDVQATATAPDALGANVVFIVGMPRSGSTLIEQILAAHPDVAGGGELGDLPAVLGAEGRRRGQPWPAWQATASAADWERLGREYLARTARWRGDRRILTDKLPLNWQFTGAIRAMLPAARIIHSHRDAMENCWSCLGQLFWRGHNYSYDPAALAATWVACQQHMEGWAARVPQRVFSLAHEALLADPEGRTRALLGFLGLPFDPACLRFHESGRVVRTASAAQVRQPLQRDTTRTPRYGAHLEPLREALVAAGWRG